MLMRWDVAGREHLAECAATDALVDDGDGVRTEPTAVEDPKDVRVIEAVQDLRIGREVRERVVVILRAPNDANEDVGAVSFAFANVRLRPSGAAELAKDLIAILEILHPALSARRSSNSPAGLARIARGLTTRECVIHAAPASRPRR